MYVDTVHPKTDLIADIILFCDTDAVLFKAIVRCHSLDLDAKVADELEYLNYHTRRRIGSGLLVNYFQFEFYSHTERRHYRVTRFDTLEDAAKVLFSEPYKERGAILMCPSSWDPNHYKKSGESAASMVSSAKDLIRGTLGFNCVTVFINDALRLQVQDAGYDEWANEMMDFAENGIAEKGSVLRIEGSAKSMLDMKSGCHPSQKTWWCPAPAEQLDSMLAFFHWKLPLNFVSDISFGMDVMFGLRSKLLTARFYCFDKREGGSRIAATDTFIFSIAGITVAEGHILGTPGLAIEPGKLCQGEVLILLEKPVAVGSRNHFVARRTDGASIGVGMIVSCS